MNTLAMEPASSISVHRRVRAAVIELVIVTAGFLTYRWCRLFTRDENRQAMRNARHVIDFERALGIFGEQTVQQWALGSRVVVDVLNRYYVSVHFPITIAFLLWVYFRHFAAYGFIRTWFALVTLTALAIHVGFPLAPPRMTPGFVDTLHEFGPRVYAADPRRSVANQFAAMPSLHFGWALMLASSVIAIKRTRRSTIILLHPVLTLLAIVATGNHYWLDAIAAGLLAAVFAVVMLGWRFLRTGQLHPVQPAALGQHERIELDDVAPRPVDDALA